MKTAEFAEFCGSSRDTLLWYDKNDILKPAVVGENGYRYYEAEQFFRYDLITILKQTGNSIKEIKAFLEGYDLHTLKAQFTRKNDALTKRIAQLTRTKRLLDEICACVDTAGSCQCGVPFLVDLPEAALAVTEVSPEGGWFFDKEGKRVREHLKAYAEREGVIRYPFGSVVSAEALLSGVFVEKQFFFPAEDGARGNIIHRKAGRYVQIFHKGGFGNAMDTLRVALAFIRTEGLRLAGDIYEYDLLTFLFANSEDESIVQFFLPVA